MKLRIVGFIVLVIFALTAGVVVGNHDPDMKLLRYLNIVAFTRALLR